tara:strand:- start:712 stop:948 length:237 start_codon:yes stop_codon:yes gene_type:complete
MHLMAQLREKICPLWSIRALLCYSILQAPLRQAHWRHPNALGQKADLAVLMAAEFLGWLACFLVGIFDVYLALYFSPF